MYCFGGSSNLLKEEVLNKKSYSCCAANLARCINLGSQGVSICEEIGTKPVDLFKHCFGLSFATGSTFIETYLYS